MTTITRCSILNIVTFAAIFHLHFLSLILNVSDGKFTKYIQSKKLSRTETC